MAVSEKYGTVNIPKIGVDEPVFILRARDILAETAIRMYQLLAASHACPLSRDLDKAAKAFRDWPGTKKLPD